MKIQLPPKEREYIRQGLKRLGMRSLKEYHRSVYWTAKHVGYRKRHPMRAGAAGARRHRGSQRARRRSR